MTAGWPSNRRYIVTCAIVLMVTALAGCSKTDEHKAAFMQQCVLVKPMEEPCSCTYDRMTTEVPMEQMARSLESGRKDPAVTAAISKAFEACTAKYR